MVHSFKRGWGKFDPDATGIIKVKYFGQLLFEIGEPLGWGELFRTDAERQARYCKMALEYTKTNSTPDTLMLFNEVFDSVAFLYMIR
jgi:hypothetical protein